MVIFIHTNKPSPLRSCNSEDKLLWPYDFLKEICSLIQTQVNAMMLQTGMQLFSKVALLY